MSVCDNFTKSNFIAENIEALKAKFSQKIDFLESKVAALESKFKEDDRVEYLDKETDKLDTKKDRNIFNCDICIKEFKSKSNLQNHDRKYHMVKGKNIYKCDNYKEAWK